LPQARKPGPAKLVLRGECLRLSSSAATNGDVSVPAVVKDVLFVGTSLEVLLECAGHRLLALVPAQRERRIAPGDAVHCQFSTADVGVLYE
nr:TOBE domain-containing protein [Thermoanaerobaculia bacterium]